MSTARVPLRQDILAALRHTKPLLDSFGVAHVSLFGPFARDEAREDSDVDLLVEFNRPIGMFEFVRLQRELSERIGRKVELVTPRLPHSNRATTVDGVFRERQPRYGTQKKTLAILKDAGNGRRQRGRNNLRLAVNGKIGGPPRTYWRR